MKKFAFAMVCTLAAVGFVLADEIAVTITKIDGNKISYYTGGGKGKKGAEPAPKKEGTAEATSDFKVYKGKFDADTKKFVKDEEVPGGLKADNFKDITDKGVAVTLNVDDKGKATYAIVKGGGAGAAKKGGKKGAAALPNGDR